MSQVRSILQPVLDDPTFRSACNAIRKSGRGVILSGLAPSAKALIAAALASELQQPAVVLVASNEAAEPLARAAATFFGWLDGKPGAVETLPAFDCSPYEGRSPHAEILERRAVTLWKIANGRVRIFFVPIYAALGRFRDPMYYRSLGLELKAGDELSLEDVVGHLRGTGYETAEPVASPGQFSVRGGIIDIFPPEGRWGGPFRIEFFGDQIESVREFDPTTQRSRKSVTSALLLPLSETQRSPALFQALVKTLRAREQSRGRADEPSWAPEYSAPFPGWEFFAPLVEDRPDTIFSLFDGAGKPLLVWDEPLDLRHQLRRAFEGWAEAFDSVRDMSPPPPRPRDVFLTEAEFFKAIEGLTQIELKELSVVGGQLPVVGSPSSAVSSFSYMEDDAGKTTSLEAPPQESVEQSPPTPHGDGERAVDRAQSIFADRQPETGSRQPTPDEFALLSRPAPKFHGDIKAWIADLRGRLERRQTVTIALPTSAKADRLREILKEYEIPFAATAVAQHDSGSGPATVPPATVVLARGDIDAGFGFPELNWLLLADNDLFGGFAWAAASRREKSIISSFISDLSDLKTGDYVVHVDHGVALYQGLRQIAIEGKTRDFMLLTFQEDAKLYVPLERLDLVEKYRAGGDGTKPVLDRLGGATWARTKTRVKRALRDMAEELLRIYAQRKTAGGHAYGADTPWQKEFEEAFEFEETPDQLTALAEIKRDLENAEPMDRLLCGDVGYGKTELAMRAAFKVVQEGRQAAVLVPTTVLAFQHFTTFRERMASFPVRIEMLSRFRSAAEQKKIVAETLAGKVDILIGTHRLLSKDVVFRDLGLLIVDEEQRFGVSSKEKLKRLRANIDVLTMSATPIPRTLHMSLGGLRDLSVIETPPRGRLAIQTVVAPFGQAIIQSAILQEMERQGQVYFVHNRVESIFSIAALIQRLVPTARIGVGHGQMGEKELERVMLKFVRNEYDVLVSTAIIENGLDIPRANTMIVNHADRFGLSDLYQLRGRVGRSDRRAYAYFLIPVEDALTPLARRRLAALKEFSDLGAGFRLAALDLELRGAGNLLGAEQSGHLDAIGLDLYLKMLEQTVEELKGTPPKLEVRTTLNLGLDIKIPDTYIADESQRLRTYKRISSLATPEERDDLEAELLDRYGPVPASILNLLAYALLKSSAEQLLVQSIERKADEIWIRFHERAPVHTDKLARFMRQRRETSLRPDGVLRFHVKHADGRLLVELRNLLQELHA